MGIRHTTLLALGGGCLALSGHATATTSTVVFPEIPTPIPCEGKAPQDLLSQGYEVIEKENGNGAKEKNAGFAALTQEALLPFIMDEDAPADKPVYVHVATKKRYTDLCALKRVNDHPTDKTTDNDIVFYTYFGKTAK